MCEDDWNCTSGVTGGFLEEFGGEGRISMEASASSQMEVTATFCPCEAEIPPAPNVACGMVRRARGVKNILEKSHPSTSQVLPKYFASQGKLFDLGRVCLHYACTMGRTWERGFW